MGEQAPAQFGVTPARLLDGADHVVAEPDPVLLSRLDDPAPVLVENQRQPALCAFHVMHAARLPAAGREIGMATIKCALTNISPKRLLFATDYPPNFVDDPIGMKTYIEKIKQLNIDKESIEDMLSANGIELLGLA